MGLICNEEVIREYLKRAEEADLSHAYLFSGTEGIGKKQVAITLAKILLCQDDRCHRQIEKRVFPDFFLLEEESMIKVEAIKELQSFLNEKPLYSKRKVLIIDNAHLMNPQAQNKLLKTLEEAPSFAHIFLITSQEQALLDTIRSRCVPVNFAPLKEEEIVSLLDASYEKEKRELAASFSGGSVRKAMNILEDEDYYRLIELPKAIIEASIKGDYTTLFDISEGIKKEELLGLLDQLGLWLRDVSVIEDNPPNEVLYYKGFQEELKEQAKSLDKKNIGSMLEDMDELRARFESHINVNSLLYQLFMGWLEE